jgi:hypothetical protein
MSNRISMPSLGQQTNIQGPSRIARPALPHFHPRIPTHSTGKVLAKTSACCMARLRGLFKLLLLTSLFLDEILAAGRNKVVWKSR